MSNGILIFADPTDYVFNGWVGKDKDSIGHLTYEKYEPKPWTEDDVDIKVKFCGICGSDLHTLRSGWFPTTYPVVVGHEIVGTAIKVGANVKHVKIGDIVGVGAQSGSCLKCETCSKHKEQYCEAVTGTYNSKYADGSQSYGGYADYSRVPGHFVIKIPDGLPPDLAAPMLCGGITVYSPLKQNNIGPGKKVGIVGIGGLGHFGILFAKALGADVTAISRNRKKEADARQMGASDFIASDEPDALKKHKRTFDLLVVTVSSADMPVREYLSMLKLSEGKMVLVGAPEDKLNFYVWPLIMNNVSLGGSNIGSPKEISEMLELAAKVGVKSWIQKVPMKDVNRALIDMQDGHARYRYVLYNEVSRL